MTGPEAPAASAAVPHLARTALALLPLQVVLRGGEALLPPLLAASFGRSEATDLYFVLAAAFVFASSIVTGAFQDSGAIPVLIEVSASDPGQLHRVAGALLGYTLAVSSAIGLATAAIASVALASRGSSLAYELVAAMALGTVATGVRAFFVGLLNSRAAFRAHPIASGLGMALTWAVILLGRRPLGVRVVPWAMLAGEGLAILILSEMARRVVGRRVAPNLEQSAAIRRIFNLIRFEITGSFITRINPLIDQLMARMAGVTGGGTLVRYSGDVASLPTSLLQATLFPALLTRLSHEAPRPREFFATLRRTLLTVLALEAGLGVAMATFRGPLCALVWGHGAMDAGGVGRIAAILPWALAGAAPFAALLVLARAHVALQNSRIMPSMGVLNSALNALFNALFVGHLGLAGIALSTSLTYLIVAIVFWVRLPRTASD